MGNLIEVYSTAGISDRMKADYWNARASECLVPLVCDIEDVQHFQGSVAYSRIGDMSLTQLSADNQVVRYTREAASRAKRQIAYLLIQLDGVSVVRQAGNESTLKSSDFALYDGTRPFESIIRGSNRMLVIGVPMRRLRPVLPEVEDLIAKPMNSKSGAGALLSTFVQQFWLEYQGGLESAVAERLAGSVVDLTGTAYCQMQPTAVSANALQRLNRIRVINFIEAHFMEADLSIRKVASSCGISYRYVHLLFADSGETVSQYILRRRLEASLQALLDNSCRTVTSIAFDHGFNSSTHFSRTFRARFGFSPSAFRESGGVRDI